MHTNNSTNNPMTKPRAQTALPSKSALNVLNTRLMEHHLNEGPVEEKEARKIDVEPVEQSEANEVILVRAEQLRAFMDQLPPPYKKIEAQEQKAKNKGMLLSFSSHANKKCGKDTSQNEKPKEQNQQEIEKQKKIKNKHRTMTIGSKE